MTVTSTTSRWEAVGNGGTTVFPYNNKIFVDTDLKVYLDGVLQTLTTHYTVSGAGTDSGGNVTFVTAPASGASVVIVRAVANTQEIDYPPGGAFPANSTEDGLDRRTIISQQNASALGRAIQYLESDANLPSPILPTLDNLKGRFLKFNASTGAPEAGVFDSGTSTWTSQNLSGDGSTTTFTLSPAVTSASGTDVYIFGVHQDPSTYTVTGASLIFSEAPPSGTDNILVRTADEVPIGVTTSDLVTHLPAGTGAVQRSVQSVLRTHMPTLEDFGGGTAVADNAAAFQAAMNAGGRLYIPSGNRYNIKNQITRTGALELVGGGSLVWTSDAASLGLSVTLTTGDQYSDRVIVEDVQFRTEKLATGTALYVDCSAANSPPGRTAPYPRVYINRAVFRGDTAPSANGWQHNISLLACSNSEITGCQITGCLDAGIGAGEAGIATVTGVKLDEGGEPTAHVAISRCNMLYCQDGVNHNGSEGVYVDKCNIIAVNRGVFASNAGAPVQVPHMSVSNTHINARSRGVEAQYMAGVFVKDCYIWERSSADAASIGVAINNCDEAFVEGNIMQGNPVTTGQDYRGVVISGTSTDVTIRDNIGENVTEMVWVQTGTDKITLQDNHVIKDAVLGPDPILYVDTTSGEVTIDSKVFSGKSASNVTAASGTLVDVDMGDVHLGQKFMVSAKVTMTKAGTDGFSTAAVAKTSGTATITWLHDDSDIRHRTTQVAGATDDYTISGLMTVTGAGTLTLRLNFTSSGSDATINAGEAQLSIVQFGSSGRYR